MTASRTCRACGAPLSGDVTWCLRCFEPRRHLTPRDAPLPVLPSVRLLEPEPERSRWRAGVNTFGPLGRVSITVAVLLLAPLSLNPVTVFVIWPCYLALAILILRSVWRKDLVTPTPTAEQIAAAAPRDLAPEPHRSSVPASTLVAWIALILVGAGLAVAWASNADVARASIAISGIVAAIVLWMRFALRT